MLDKGFTHFGEETDAKRRTGLLDAGLEVLAGLTSGRPFSYEGEHHRVEEVTFLPEPVQSPGISVWIGGAWPRKASLRRAARGDGFVPFKETVGGRQDDMTPDDEREIGAAAGRERPDAAPFDIVVGGEERRADWDEERSVIASLAEVGANWWLEWVPAAGFEEMSRTVGRAPLRAWQLQTNPRRTAAI